MLMVCTIVWSLMSSRRRLQVIATRTPTETVIRIRDLTAFSEVQKSALIRRFYWTILRTAPPVSKHDTVP